MKEARALLRELQKKNSMLEEKKSVEIKTMEEMMKRESSVKVNQIRAEFEQAVSKKEEIARQLERAGKEFEKKLLLA